MVRRRDDEYGALDDLLGSDDGPPADLPADYAEAWRQGYERARLEVEPTVAIGRAARPGPPAAPTDRADHANDVEDTAALDLGGGRPGPTEPTVAAPTPETPAPAPAHERDEDERRRTPLVLLAVVAVLLIVAAFGVGRLFADDASQLAQEQGGSDGSGDGEAAGGEAGAASYQGPVSDVQVAGSTATCQAPSSVDAGGNPTTYQAALAHDADLSTAWRCAGRGAGERLTITLPQETTVALVGLVPGYAKTDPVSGVDRYAENNRITRVRWSFDDGTSFVQKMSGAADDRSMRTRRIPETATGSVVLEILGSTRGPRNTVAVSEVRIAQPAG